MRGAKEKKRLQEPEYVPFAISLLVAVYGRQSAQFEAFNTALDRIAKNSNTAVGMAHQQAAHAMWVIENTFAELDAGLIGNIRVEVAGEIIAELIGLAKESLEDKTDSSTNVAAVLTAAAFEDAIRRMGSEFAGVTGRPKLEAVITALKTTEALRGADAGIAQSYLQFRNDSLHADWAKIERSQVQSCIGFLEGLLSRKFS